MNESTAHILFELILTKWSVYSLNDQTFMPNQSAFLYEHGPIPDILHNYKTKLNHVKGTLTNKFTLITFAKIILQHVVHKNTFHVYSLLQLCDINAKLSACIVTDQYICTFFCCIIRSDIFPQLFSCQMLQICILRWSSLDFKF